MINSSSSASGKHVCACCSFPQTPLEASLILPSTALKLPTVSQLESKDLSCPASVI